MKAQTALAPISMKPSSITEFWNDVDNLMQGIRQRAYQFFEWRGRTDGHDLEDWFKAEMELLKPVPLEISEKDDVIHIRADVPGFTQEELQINLEPGVLTIKGEHREEKEKKEDKIHRTEKRAKQIFRRIALPVNVNPDKATANLEGGILELSAPKAEAGKKIEIKAA